MILPDFRRGVPAALFLLLPGGVAALQFSASRSLETLQQMHPVACTINIITIVICDRTIVLPPFSYQRYKTLTQP